VFAKDPNRRKSRSGSRARANGVRSNSKSERSAGASRSASEERDGSFVLYVEGARDREILECWARRLDPALARCVERNTVILGGRRPARAIADFQKRGGADAGHSGLIVLDRDHHGSNSVQSDGGLEIFVWSLRHIESYLLVPSAIRRMLRLDADDRTVERFIEIHATDDTTTTTTGEVRERSEEGVSTHVRGSLHAKRILGAGGSLSEALGAELRAGDIARAMRVEDLHGDVHNLFGRIGMLSGAVTKGPEVVIRPS
jgi:hypothetical protein